MRFVHEFPPEHRPSRYPWRVIAESGKIAELTAGEDFTVKPEQVGVLARRWALRHGYRCTVCRRDDVVLVRFER